MNRYIAAMDTYLEEMLPRRNGQNLPELLEELYFLYLDISGRDAEPVEDCYQAFLKDICRLSHARQSSITAAVDRLCSEQQRSAFMAGMQMGARLMMELQMHTQ